MGDGAAGHGLHRHPPGGAERLLAGPLPGMLPYLRYGLLPLFAVPAAVMTLRRPSRAVLLAPAAGPAVVPVALLACAALLGVAALGLAGVARGEGERIWLPCAAWVTVAAAHRPPCGTLFAQVATAVALQDW
ncbi:hypothetical protein GCM10022214_40020 [Actinomadura miaoliensis]|uniref:Uncharacterized protein n=2 Tax=Actinomadura miaoliensis TaxID=430685 RepID=A0ABP7W1L2_9ACTN